jgi:glycosyltransferase involved in cell wall biosynthesis
MKTKNKIKKEGGRIALYLNHLEIGGAETIFIELARGFIELGFKVDFLLGERRGALLSKIPASARVIELNISNAVRGIPKLVQYFRCENPAAFLTITELTSLAALIAKLISGASTYMMIVLATTISRHKRAPLKKRLEQVLVALLYPTADGIVSVSRGAAEDLARYAGIPSESIKVVYSPVLKPGLFGQMTESISHPFFQSEGVPVVLGVGRLTEPKNFPLLVEAFALLRQRMPSRLIILGEGEMRPVLEDLISTLGVRNDVSLPGFVPSPYPYMSRASVFVMSSMWEGLPGVLIEAMACGAPVVSTDCPSGPSEILDGGRYGHLVPVGNPQALADAIESSLRGDQRKPPAKWLEQFSTQVVINQYLELMSMKDRASI